MKLIGFGCNCDVASFLKKHYPGEYYPFDWIWSNIDFVIQTFETDHFEFTECEKLTVAWEPNNYLTYIFNNNCTGGKERICSAISLHDANHKTALTYPDHIPVINEKYKRRFQRLYEALQSDDDVFLIRKVLDRDQGAVKPSHDSNEKINYLMNLLTRKFKARITLCVVDEDFLTESTLHKDIKLFHSFDELRIYIDSAFQVFNLLSLNQI
jgi:hypothetical protein